MKHTPATPLPWMYGENSEEVITPRGRAVAGLPSDAIFEGDIDMRYIAHAANAYPRLVEALRDLIEHPSNRPSASALLRDLGEAS